MEILDGGAKKCGRDAWTVPGQTGDVLVADVSQTSDNVLIPT